MANIIDDVGSIADLREELNASNEIVVVAALTRGGRLQFFKRRGSGGNVQFNQPHQVASTAAAANNCVLCDDGQGNQILICP